MKSDAATRQPEVAGPEKGYLLLMLNTHMPYVRNFGEAETEEENWLYEAMTECYIPLLDVCQRLVADKVPVGVTMSISPCLLDMLEDDLVLARFRQYLSGRIALSRQETERLRDHPHLLYLAQQNHHRFTHVSRLFDRWQGDLLQMLRTLSAGGCLELLPSSATHAFLPLWLPYPHVIEFQVLAGVRKYEKVFGSKPAGFWLPECAYYPGLDAVLARCGVKFFFLEAHGICHAYPRPAYDVHAPIHCPTGVAAFGRSWFCHNQVWSKEFGYPGDANYLNVDRDIGYELDPGALAPFTRQPHRGKTGICYHSTGGWLYHPDSALARADLHALDFMWKCQNETLRLHWEMGGRKPVLAAVYDTEHFGHWWREGPLWLDLAIRKMAYDQKDVKMVSALEYLRLNPTNQVATPSASSWGHFGYYEVWLTGQNQWVYPQLFTAIEQFDDLLEACAHPTAMETAALNQYLRELMLAQNSDLFYMLDKGAFRGYAERRVKSHLDNMRLILKQISQKRIDSSWLLEVSKQDEIFEDLDLLGLYREAKARASVAAFPA